MIAGSIVALGLAPPAACADSQNAPYHADQSTIDGDVDTVVLPDFPQSAISKRQNGYVDVEGWVTPFGRLDEASYSADSAESGVFVDALKEVMGRWRFGPPLDDNCLPTRQRIALRVWFEADGDRPKIFVSKTKSEPGSQVWRALRRVKPRYPPAALELGLEATVYVTAHVDPSGRVVKVETKTFTANGSPTSRFDTAVSHALMEWEFPKRDDDQVRRLCYRTIFNIIP